MGREKEGFHFHFLWAHEERSQFGEIMPNNKKVKSVASSSSTCSSSERGAQIFPIETNRVELPHFFFLQPQPDE